MADTVAETQTGVVVMHNREATDPACDIIADMRRFFDRSLALAQKAGIPAGAHHARSGHRLRQIGGGRICRRSKASRRLRDYGLPILVGLSRKSLLGAVVGEEPVGEMKIEPRLIATLAANLVAAANGATIFRVHDAAEHVAAFKVFDAIHRA